MRLSGAELLTQDLYLGHTPNVPMYVCELTSALVVIVLRSSTYPFTT